MLNHRLAGFYPPQKMRTLLMLCGITTLSAIPPNLRDSRLFSFTKGLRSLICQHLDKSREVKLVKAAKGLRSLICQHSDKFREVKLVKAAKGLRSLICLHSDKFREVKLVKY